MKYVYPSVSIFEINEEREVRVCMYVLDNLKKERRKERKKERKKESELKSFYSINQSINRFQLRSDSCPILSYPSHHL